MTCRICNGTGVVTEVLSHVGEPPDYWPIDCPQCNGTGETVANRQTTYIANEEVHHGWEHEPDDCRREPSWSTCPICEDGGWAYSKVDGQLVYCRCEVGQWTREQDEAETDRAPVG